MTNTSPITAAIVVLRAFAGELKQSHTVGGLGDWTDEPEAKASHDELLIIADGLDAIQKDHA